MWARPPCSAGAECAPLPPSSGWALGDPPPQGTWLSPRASTLRGAVGASLVQQMQGCGQGGKLPFSFPSKAQSPLWPDAWNLPPGDRGAPLRPAGILVQWLLEGGG